MQLGAPESGAPNYSGRDRQYLELRLAGTGLLNASLRRGELVVLVRAGDSAGPEAVAATCADALERRPTSVRVSGLGAIGLPD